MKKRSPTFTKVSFCIDSLVNEFIDSFMDPFLKSLLVLVLVCVLLVVAVATSSERLALRSSIQSECGEASSISLLGKRLRLSQSWRGPAPLFQVDKHQCRWWFRAVFSVLAACHNTLQAQCQPCTCNRVWAILYTRSHNNQLLYPKTRST